MSFETAKSVTPESFSQQFNFTRRPQVQYPVREAPKQSINISRDTLAKAARKKLHNPYAPKLSYGNKGVIDRGAPVGQILSSFA
ncbi:hypothetical protein [Pelagicoccus sp. SDUM812003]|uniref:hypothetical protein n=1 Tax=Pelagicoccus sp. SDUM812003 TaxID=3041267 RepID=UPI00280DC344|nr:hypothetical protein [Pelagicoccus sp. SDUM812003]MDQ8205618.1 hypothetical protein [Pelagicoccus sp. SDUM812003]